ncbi:uncharacterized protein LOC135163596 isoform X3 [Diachasmimorpha longicaudata]|uniref:uncharacterized protein LOC135163596 isoform X3 n=1 Tax=Diachasmimorpha longicaudata TaxID=58733 RepID=UPI0030B9127E
MLAQQNLLFYPSSVSLNDFSPQIRGSSGWWLQFRAKFPGISTSGIPREWISPMRIAEVIIQHRIVCPLSQQEFPSHGLHIPAWMFFHQHHMHLKWNSLEHEIRELVRLL